MMRHVACFDATWRVEECMVSQALQVRSLIHNPQPGGLSRNCKCYSSGACSACVAWEALLLGCCQYSSLGRGSGQAPPLPQCDNPKEKKCQTVLCPPSRDLTRSKGTEYEKKCVWMESFYEQISHGIVPALSPHIGSLLHVSQKDSLLSYRKRCFFSLVYSVPHVQYLIGWIAQFHCSLMLYSTVVSN